MNLKNKDMENVIEIMLSRYKLYISYICKLYTYNYAERKSIKFIILLRDTIFFIF